MTMVIIKPVPIAPRLPSGLAYLKTKPMSLLLIYKSLESCSPKGEKCLKCSYMKECLDLFDATLDRLKFAVFHGGAELGLWK